MSEHANPGDDATRIVVCVGGSIAAYKACDLVSKLVQKPYDVDVVMTEAAEQFVRPLSFSALTHKPVFTQATWFAGEGAQSPADHLQATEEAVLVVVAPCTANLIGKLAAGIADEIVSTTLLGAACPVLLVPAMNPRMWANRRVQANVAVLKEDGVQVLGPDTGNVAEGPDGTGRMVEPEGIVAEVDRLTRGASGTS